MSRVTFLQNVFLVASKYSESYSYRITYHKTHLQKSFLLFATGWFLCYRVISYSGKTSIDLPTDIQPLIKSKQVNGLRLVSAPSYTAANFGTKIYRGRVLRIQLVKLLFFNRIVREFNIYIYISIYIYIYTKNL